MLKPLFVPFNLIGGILAGALSRKLVARIWAAFDDERAPDPKHREIATGKLIPALMLEGMVMRVVRGLFDHGSRRAFSRLTGSWPGEERPEPE